MGKTKIAFCFAVLSLAGAVLYCFTAARRPGVPGDLRDAPSAIEQIGYGAGGAGAVPQPAAPAPVEAKMRGAPQNGGGAVIYKGQSYYPPEPSPGEGGFQASVNAFEDKAITELSIVNHADGQSGRMLISNAANLRTGARDADYITAKDGKFFTGSKLGDYYEEHDFTGQMDAKLAPSAVINLIGCKTGGTDVKSVNSSLAAKVSLALPGRTVIAFVGDIKPAGILILELGGITNTYKGKAIVSCVTGNCTVIDKGGTIFDAKKTFNFPLR